jgi:hypothetical protein
LVASAHSFQASVNAEASNSAVHHFQLTVESFNAENYNCDANVLTSMSQIGHTAAKVTMDFQFFLSIVQEASAQLRKMKQARQAQIAVTPSMHGLAEAMASWEILIGMILEACPALAEAVIGPGLLEIYRRSSRNGTK